jgi:DNA-directed RNA polymerase subunit RPC12/RpoP
MNLQNRAKNRKSEQEFTYKCSDCGADVKVTLGELLFLDDKDLVVSTRCKDCREAKNKRFEEYATNKEQ